MTEPETVRTSARAGGPEGQTGPAARRTRIGAYAVSLDESGRVLLCRLSADEVEAGAWTLPGGGLEFGEHPDDAVLRELAEEAGLVGRIDALLGVFSRVYVRSIAANGGDFHFLGFLYRVTPVGGELRDEIGGSTDTCAWFRPDDLEGMRIVGVARHGLELALPGLRLTAAASTAAAGQPTGPTG